LNSGGGGFNRPLVEVTAGMGTADIALKELLDEKIGYDLPDETPAVRPVPKKRKKH